MIKSTVRLVTVALIAASISGCCGIGRLPSVATVKRDMEAIRPGMDEADAAKVLRKKGFPVSDSDSGLSPAQWDAIKKGRWHPNPSVMSISSVKKNSVCLLTDTYIEVTVWLDNNAKVTSVTVEEHGEGP